MSKFVDKLGREWTFTVDVAAMRRAKKAGVDLSMPVKQLQEFVMDDVFMVDALWAVVSPDAESKAVTLEQFEKGLDGKVLEVAQEALWEALCEYYPDPKAQMLRAALASVKTEMAKVATSLTSNG